jgi:hypothetical protein
MREWKVTDGYKVKADELSWEELKNATENVIEEKRKSHRIVVLDGYGLNPGDLSWEGIERMGEFTVYDRTSVDEIVSRAALAARIFSLIPPTGRTFPRNVISPSIARLLCTIYLFGHVVRASVERIYPR